MHVIEHYDRSVEPLVSFEIIPPKRGGAVKQIFEALKQLTPYRPPFIDVTSHAAQAYVEELSDGTLKRKIRRKRPGTIGLCAAILNRFGIDPVPHLLCTGFTREETEDALIELNYLGIHNVMALRGDNNAEKKIDPLGRASNRFASDLVYQIQQMNQGIYLERLENAEKTNFCVGVAGYPEKHVEARNLSWDIQKLKEKVDQGADYIVTQMFFDNRVYFDFVEKAREAGIQIPIIPGLKIITSSQHLSTLPEYFHLSIPEEISHEIDANPNRILEIGVEWTVKQSNELLSYGVPGLHYYVMTNPAPAIQVLDQLPVAKQKLLIQTK
jgi:methylenetetrahydrofolate reductase (NADPH)